MYASALLLFVLGCSNSDLPVGADSMQTENSNVNVLTSAIVSDPSLDPYSIENMNKAMRKSVLAKSSVMDSTEVESMELKPNYLYVRFLVSGKDEFAELKSRDTTVVYFKHPLDYKPIKKPAVYVDPTLPDSVRPYFAAVPVDFDFGSTKYDVIKELFHQVLFVSLLYHLLNDYVIKELYHQVLFVSLLRQRLNEYVIKELYCLIQCLCLHYLL